MPVPTTLTHVHIHVRACARTHTYKGTEAERKGQEGSQKLLGIEAPVLGRDKQWSLPWHSSAASPDGLACILFSWELLPWEFPHALMAIPCQPRMRGDHLKQEWRQLFISHTNSCEGPVLGRISDLTWGGRGRSQNTAQVFTVPDFRMDWSGASRWLTDKGLSPTKPNDPKMISRTHVVRKNLLL